MTNLERHKALLRQSMDLLELSVAKGALDNSRAIAFAASSGAVDLLSIFLHRAGKLPTGKIIEHQWFKSPKPEQKKTSVYERKLSVDFQRKKEIFNLMCAIEEKRTKLAYGNPTEGEVSSVIKALQKLKELIERELGESLG